MYKLKVHTVRYGSSSIPKAIIQQEKKSKSHNLHYGASKESKGGERVRYNDVSKVN